MLYAVGCMMYAVREIEAEREAEKQMGRGAEEQRSRGAEE
jgi:hypothetical protein